MRDEQQCHGALGLLCEEKIGNLPAGFRVEIARWLVGDKHGRRGGQSPRDGDALLFSPGKLSGVVAQPLAETDRLKLTSGDIEGVAHVGEFERHRDVLERRHVGDQVEGLENDADIAAPEIRQGVLVQVMQRRAVDEDLATIKSLETRKNHEKRRFAGPGRADDADGLALVDHEVDLFQHVHCGSGASERQIGLLHFDDGFSHARSPYMLSVACRTGLPSAAGSGQFREGEMRFKAAIPLFAALAFVAALMPGPLEAEDRPVQIVGFGDSLMAGYQLPPEDALPAHLEKALTSGGRRVVIANAGVSGDTSAAGLARVDWSVPDGTDGVILELGANDALRGIAPEETEKNLDEIIGRLRQRGIEVLLVGMLSPPNMGSEYRDRFNPIYKRLADKYGLEFYPFILDGVATQADLKIDDGMHPNAKGIAVITQRMLPVMERFLGRISSATN